jgi:DNA-binding NarL/FixJ family response regulator
MCSASVERKTRILVVDDHPLLRAGVAAMIDIEPDMELVGEAEDGAQAIEQFRILRPDVTLMDLQLPSINGVDAIKAILGEFPAARIIVLTTYSGDAQALRAIKAGAAGYLLKSTLRMELLSTIRAIHAGRRHVAPEIATEIVMRSAEEALTEREIEVLRLVARGYANKQIAKQLSTTEETVKTHMKNIFAKLNVADRTLAVTHAAKRGIIEI